MLYTVMKKTLRYATDEKTYAKKKKKIVNRLPAGAAICGFVVKVF
jgi:hypothetical protein